MLESIGSMGAGLIKTVLMLAWLAAAAWCGIKAAGDAGCYHMSLRRKVTGWGVGIIAFFAIGAVVWPSMEALNERSCRGAEEYEDCINGEGDYEPGEVRTR